MSGSSFNYLCYGQVDSLFTGHGGQLQSMVDVLKANFHGSQAAKETAELQRFIGYVTAEIERRAEPLRDVWHAVEWWKSSDYSRDQAQAEINRYDAIIEQTRQGHR